MSKARLANNDNFKEALSSLQNRPWKNNRFKSKSGRSGLAVFLVYDKLYDIYIKYDFKIRGSQKKFQTEAESTLRVKIGSSFWDYFKTHGDPRTDSEWVRFKKDINLINI
jgi:hypothetical protein